MGRSFQSILNQMAREAARRQRMQEAAEARSVREALKAFKSAEQQRRLEEKDAKARYLDSRSAEAEEKNAAIAESISDLQGILQHTLSVDDTISFDSIRPKEKFSPFRALAELSTPVGEPNPADFFRDIKKPAGIAGIVPGAKKAYAEAMAQAELRYAAAQERNRIAETERLTKLNAAEAGYNEQKRVFEERQAKDNAAVDEFEQSYCEGDPDAVIAYNAMVLERSSYPSDFPQEFRLAYVPDSKELVIEYELPGLAIVPSVLEYRYNKTRDVIDEKPRKPGEIKELYQDVVAAVTLRTVHEVCEADQAGNLAIVTFNGFVQDVDRATGKDIRPCLVSVRVTKERFAEIDLARVDKRACLRNLGAQVSPRPAELQAVKPIVDFNMVDRRFVEQSDVLADLESRPNLIELTPFEFENLVSNLFTQMGLETRLTQASRDGGVDCVAYDLRPVLGGKIVIQAKRYSNTVGVSAVRDLYGTMMNEGANKGILVSTSSYGPDAYDFAKDKPIELIDGGGLLYLLDQNGVKARIVFPQLA